MVHDRDERIRERAYTIWEREGRPDGRGDEHWRLAMEEIDWEDVGRRTEGVMLDTTSGELLGASSPALSTQSGKGDETLKPRGRKAKDAISVGTAVANGNGSSIRTEPASPRSRRKASGSETTDASAETTKIDGRSKEARAAKAAATVAGIALVGAAAVGVGIAARGRKGRSSKAATSDSPTTPTPDLTKSPAAFAKGRRGAKSGAAPVDTALEMATSPEMAAPRERKRPTTRGASDASTKPVSAPASTKRTRRGSQSSTMGAELPSTSASTGNDTASLSPDTRSSPVMRSIDDAGLSMTWSGAVAQDAPSSETLGSEPLKSLIADTVAPETLSTDEPSS